MAQAKQPRNLYGIVLMLIHALALTILYANNKFIMEFISSNQLVFLYKTAVLLGALPWILKNGKQSLKTDRLHLHLLRGIVSTSGGLLFTYGLSKVDIASATAINKMEPILLMLLASFYFKEKLSTEKIVTIILSMLGMLMVSYQVVAWGESGLNFPWLNNGGKISSFNYYYLIIFGAVLLWTVNSSIVKSLGSTESNKTQLFYISLISVLFSMPFALCSWKWANIGGIQLPYFDSFHSIFNIGLTKSLIGLIMLSALMHFLHVICYFQSMKVAEMSVVIPFDYARLVFGAIFGYVFFHEEPTFSAFMGYLLILVSGVYLLRHTSKKA